MRTQDLAQLKKLEQKNRNRELLTDEEYKQYGKLMVERVNEFIDELWP